VRARRCHLGVAALAAAIVALSLTTGVAQALLVKLSPQQLTRKADRVLVADVWSVRARHVKPADGRGWGTIETVVRLRVVDRLKGSPPAWLKLRVPGGTADALVSTVEDAPAFYPGERVLLFLDEHGVVGWREGALEIVDGEVAAWDVSLRAAEQRITGKPVRQRPRVAGPGAAMPGPAPAAAPAAAVAPAAAPTGASPALKRSTVQTVLSDGFESGMGNWTLYGSATWGRTTYRKQAGSYSAYGTQSGGTAPASYPNSADARMTYGPFSLSDATAASLQFDLWKLIPDADDQVQVWFSNTGYDWTGYYYYDTIGWAHVTQDLGSVDDGAGGTRSLLGQAQVWVMFRFISDAAEQTEGGYVDNVAISKTVGTDPTIGGISPGSASAGTNTNVTISGANFGAAQGAGGVTFYYSGVDRISAPVVSWSDTQIVCTVPTAIIGGYPAAAGSGPVIVTSDAGRTSTGYPFTVTFAYGGARWASPSVTYSLNSNCVDTTAETTLVDAAWPTWNPPALWTLNRSGTNTRTSRYNGIDLVNEIFWSQSSLGTGVLAVNHYWWWLADPTHIVDSDIEFNDADFIWGDGTVGGTYDIQSVALHELGHTINLRDLYGAGDAGKVMYGYTSSATQKRTLSADDTAGVVWVYGARPPMSGTISVSGGAAWTKSTTVTLDSAVVNATEMRFSNDNASWSGWQAYSATKAGWTLTAGDGAKTVYGQYKDAGGNVYARSDTIGLDTTKPVTGDDHDDLWHGRATVTLSPMDGGSGVAATQYRVDGGAWQTGTSFTLKTWKRGGNSGEHTVDYQSTDVAGNVGTLASCVVRLDGKPPTTTSDAPVAPVAGPLTVHLTAVDQAGLSGVAATYYRLDASGWTQGTSVAVSGVGLHILTYYSVDNAGKAEPNWHPTLLSITL